ncbi:MAG: hypothetical protein QW802_04965 [Candidatus Altiarchaeota archaeon]
MEKNKRNFFREFLLLYSSLVAVFLLISVTSPDNCVGPNCSTFSATENISRPDEYSQWLDIQEIKNQSNRSLPIITIGGVNTIYGEGDNIAIFASITLHGAPVDPESYCNITIVHWNGSSLQFYLNSTQMTKIFVGWYYLNWTIPSGIKHQGTYSILIEADPLGKKTQATSGFKVGFTINATISVDTSLITEQMDCDGIDDSPICEYTKNMNNITSIILDMLNCENNGNNSDICNYTKNLETNISDLRNLLRDVNYSMWNKLLLIESTSNTIRSYVENISEALDCDNSENDVCKKVNELRIFLEEVNSTTHKTLDNVTLMLPQLRELLSNVSDVKNYLEILIKEFNCTSVNPSDVCYRLELIQNATGPLLGILNEINTTTHRIDTTLSYINRTSSMISIAGLDTIYGEGNTITAYALITFHGEPIEPDTYINLTVIHWNGSSIIYDLNSIAMNKISTGWYYYSWTIPSNAFHGSYAVLIEADPLGKKTQATSGFKVGFDLNVTITLDTSAISKMLDCDGIDDSPICEYISNLQSSVNKIQDMLNCSNLGNNSDLCNYAERIESNLSLLREILTDHNKTIWDKLLDIETTINAINANTTAIFEALDCDNSENDICKKISDINTLIEIINITTIDTLNNATYIASKVNILLSNITTIHDYVESLIIEFNCTSVNPSDVCYRLELIQNATTGGGSLADLLAEVNRTIHETLNMVNYINEVKWGNFSYTQPIPTVLILQGKVKRKGTNDYLSVGSIQVNITDAYVPFVIWSHEYNDIIHDNMFNIMIGGTHDLSLIPKRKYKRDITVCDGITFDPTLYTCETFTTYFIA